MEKYTLISLFSGCGGMDLGFKQCGFDILWANDFFKLFLFHHSFPCVKSKSFLVALSVCLSDESYLTTLSNICQQEIVSFFIYFSFSIECPFLGLNHLCNSKVSVELCELCNISFVAKKSLSHFILYPPICKRKRCV